MASSMAMTSAAAARPVLRPRPRRARAHTVAAKPPTVGDGGRTPADAFRAARRYAADAAADDSDDDDPAPAASSSSPGDSSFISADGGDAAVEAGPDDCLLIGCR